MRILLDEAAKSRNRQLLRALLRESSYLPDHGSRCFFHNHIISRFRAYNRKNVPWREQDDFITASSTARLARNEELYRKGRKALRQLNRANNGYTLNLLKVLFWTYGRRGPRRYQLLEPLKRPEGRRHLNDPVLKLKNRRNLSSDFVDKLPGLTSKLHALLTAQVQHSPPEIVKPRLKRLGPEIPEQNIWMRPTPRSRVATIVKSWYADVLNKALAPPPEAEFEELKQLACGAKQWPGRPSRRHYCGDKQELGLYHDRLGLLMPQATLKDLANADHQGGIHRPHHLSSKRMRSLYKEVFKVCPSMHWDSEREKWRVTWGYEFLHVGKRASESNAPLLEKLEQLSSTASGG